jgi:hypothetical protein
MSTAKKREIDKDTVVAYHEYIQGRIKDQLNGVALGPGRLPCRIAIGVLLFGFACLIVGILIITVRTRHVYLWDWNDQFLGPFFVMFFIMCLGMAVFLLLIANKKSNTYRRELAVCI